MSFFAKKTSVTTRADKLAEFQSCTCQFGSPLFLAYGLCKCAPNVINHIDFRAVEHATTVKTGKKSSSTTVDYYYYVYTELALAEGAIAGINRVYVGDKTYSSLAALNSSGNNVGSGLSLNVGNNPNPTAYMSAHHPDRAVGYKDMAYLYGTIFLGINSNGMPSYAVEVYGMKRETGDGVDANPADVIIDLLARVGLSSYIDAVSFDNYRRYCKAADLLISSPMDAFSSQRKCQEVISEILTLTNAYMFWSVNKFKIVPRDDRQYGSWVPDREIKYDLTTDDFLPQTKGSCVSFAKKDTAEKYNRFGVTFTNRANDYESETVFYEIPSDIAANGIKASNTINGQWFHTKIRAVKCAEMAARMNSIEDTKYTFKLTWNYGRLEPGDLVTLTDSSIGLNRQPAMVESITEDNLGRLTVTAIKRAAGNYTAAIYDVHDHDYNTVDFNMDPHNTMRPVFIIPPPELTTSASGIELWIAVHGEHENWGGCSIYVSDKDGDYSLHGVQGRSSIYGFIATDMDSESDSVMVQATNPRTIELLAGSVWDAEQANTLLWIDGEYVSYTAAVLMGENRFMLSGLKRGQFGTTPVEHKAGVDAVLCDSNLYVVELPKHYQERNLFFKFPAFNILRTNEQLLHNLPYYSTQATGTAKPPADVNVLDTELLFNGTRRFWWDFTYPETNDVAGFRIRYVQGNHPNWATGIELHTGLLTQQPFETDALRQGIHTVMIKAVDTVGNESVNAAYAVINLGEPLEDNVLFRADLSADRWADTYHNGDVTQEGYLRTKDNTVFWSNPADSFWRNPTDEFWVGKYSELLLNYAVKAPAGGLMWLDYDIDGVFRLEYRVVGKGAFWSNPQDCFWAGLAEDAFWNDKTSLWKPYTCKVEVAAGDIIQVRAYTASSNLPTTIKALELVIDVPDREEHFENVEVPEEGVYLDVQTPNYYTTAVRIDAVQSVNTAVYRAVVVQKNPCFIKLVDANNNPMAAQVDVTWQGFKREVL